MLNEYKYIIFMVIKWFLLVGCILRKLNYIYMSSSNDNYFKAVTIHAPHLENVQIKASGKKRQKAVKRTSSELTVAEQMQQSRAGYMCFWHLLSINIKQPISGLRRLSSVNPVQVFCHTDTIYTSYLTMQTQLENIRTCLLSWRRLHIFTLILKTLEGSSGLV